MLSNGMACTESKQWTVLGHAAIKKMTTLRALVGHGGAATSKVAAEAGREERPRWRL